MDKYNYYLSNIREVYMTNTNPLQGYYRQIKTYIKLPSGKSFYTEDTMTLNEDGEIGIRAMTAQDELILKNPDALLNGEAVKQVLLSCVVGLVDPSKLLGNDVDAMQLAIKNVSFGGVIETSLFCPKCNHLNEFDVNLDAIGSNTTFLDAEYPVNLSNGLTVFVKPFTFNDRLKTLKKTFEQQRTQRILTDDSISDERKLQAFSLSFTEMTRLTSELLAGSIHRVIGNNGEIDITDDGSSTSKKVFAELLQNIEVSDVKLIDAQTKDINQVGVQTDFEATCKECEHKWESRVELNPVNFSIES